MKRYKRKNIFIKKDFQGKLILGYFLFVTGGCLFFFVLLGLFSADSLTISYQNYDLQLEQTPAMLFQQAITSQWLFIVIGTIFLIIAAMLVTHRIAGPIFRFEKTLDSMLNRNLNDTIYLRPKDEAKDLAIKINRFNTDLSQNLKNISSHSKALEELLNQALQSSDSLPGKQQESLNSLLWNIQKKNEKISTICSSYTPKDD